MLRSCRDLSDRMGTPYLQTTLNKELSRHIQETLPVIRNSLRTKMLELKKELSAMEDLSSPAAMRNILLKYISIRKCTYISSLSPNKCHVNLTSFLKRKFGCFAHYFFRALRDFAEDVETQIQGLNAEIDTQTLAGGAKINRLFYNEFADALSLVSRN